jgi:uncharacterized lipoprotein YddW (UPF0748 family)
MLTALLLVFFVFIISACQTPQTHPEPSPEPVRGVWLTNVVSEAMFSNDQIVEAVEFCHELGFNTIFVVVWNRGYTLYPSEVMAQRFGISIDPKHAGRDPLQEVIDAARKHGIQVYAWFEFGFAASYQEPDGGHLLRRYPHWAAIDSAGQIVSKNGFQWMNGFDPEVQDFVLSLLKEVARNYEVAGIQGDDRLPALPSLAGYDSLTLAAYANEHEGASPPKDPFEPGWVDWRADRLNAFMARMHKELKALDPELQISVSPSIFPWSKQQYLQDWPTWVANGWVDMVCPQIYRYDLEKYQHELRKIVQEQVAPEKHDILFPGVLARVGSYYASDTLLGEFVAANRKQGLSGEVFFYYEALKKHPDFYRQLYRK